MSEKGIICKNNQFKSERDVKKQYFHFHFISQIPHSLYNLLRTDAFMKMHWMIFIFLLQERIHLVCISIMQFLCQCYRAISSILFKRLSWYKHMVMESKRYLLVEKSISITHYMLGAYIFQFFYVESRYAQPY